MSLEVIKNLEEKSLIRELEGYGLNRLESELLFLCLSFGHPLTTKDFVKKLKKPKHQIYSVLKKLEKQFMIKRVGSKPKQFFSDGDILLNSYSKFEQDLDIEYKTLKNIEEFGKDKAYLLLGFDNDAVRIHCYLIKSPATRTELMEQFSDCSYEKIRNICDFLLYQKAITKSLRGKNILYSGIALEDIIELKLADIKNRLKNKKKRLDRILNIIHEEDIKIEEKTGSKTHEKYENITPLLENHSQEATEILNSLFSVIDHNFPRWKNLIVSELSRAIELSFREIKVKWLVDRAFIEIFNSLSNDLKEQTINAYPRFSIRIVNRYSSRVYIVDEDLYFEFPQASQFLNQTLLIQDESATKVKRIDFLEIWRSSHDFLPLFYDSIGNQEPFLLFDQLNKLTNLKTFNIAFLGNKGVGKTSIVKRYITDRWDPYIKVTLGILVDESYIRVPKRIETTKKVEYEEVKLVIWDYGGQENFTYFYPDHLVGKEALVLIFALDEFKSFLDLEFWINLFSSDDIKKLNIFLVGAKKDLEGDLDMDKIWDFRKKYNIEHYIETSALLGINIKKLFQDLSEILYSQFE